MNAEKKQGSIPSYVATGPSGMDGGNIRARKEVTRATSEVDKQKLEVDMYAINERVTQLFLASCY